MFDITQIRLKCILGVVNTQPFSQCLVLGMVLSPISQANRQIVQLHPNTAFISLLLDDTNTLMDSPHRGAIIWTIYNDYMHFRVTRCWGLPKVNISWKFKITKWKTDLMVALKVNMESVLRFFQSGYFLPITGTQVTSTMARTASNGPQIRSSNIDRFSACLVNQIWATDWVVSPEDIESYTSYVFLA